jgi:hypothetical protein
MSSLITVNRGNGLHEKVRHAWRYKICYGSPGVDREKGFVGSKFARIILSQFPSTGQDGTESGCCRYVYED